jgi:hypothetical protein
MAPVVQRIVTLRAEGKSEGKIADATGMEYSTMLTILNSRIYLAEGQMNGEWFSGRHEATITPGVVRRRPPGRARGQGAPTSSRTRSAAGYAPPHGHRSEQRGSQALLLPPPGSGLHAAPPDQRAPSAGDPADLGHLLASGSLAHPSCRVDAERAGLAPGESKDSVMLARERLSC